jgi:hypothetical protein
MIAVQLSAFRFDESIVLHAVTVLDVAEEIPIDAVDPLADRIYWEKRSDPAALAVVDKIVSLLRVNSTEPRVTYNRYHMALGTSGRNFCWFYPRKRFCRMRLRIGAEVRDAILSSLEEGGIDASARRTDGVVFPLTVKSIDEHQQLIRDALKQAEEASRA